MWTLPEECEEQIVKGNYGGAALLRAGILLFLLNEYKPVYSLCSILKGSVSQYVRSDEQ